ncbi:hypothetical protein [Streptomyces sp. NBC_00083]|uniref:hypothetical protein n=1 Tax=Streptomyces sp. NBC_00083 TaxID=2975647 RepID=UPI002256F03F|nr:hypothetical protein [Streptomyces sp. NBC_00083]MCX5384116.1 hypothetical protein [Streptomyces sp. NBC_00083]
MRRCATVAAIVLCGVLTAGTAAPAFAAPPTPAVPAPGTAPGADEKAWLADLKKEIDKLIADEKKDAAADVAEAKADAAKELKEINDMIKTEKAQSTPASSTSALPAASAPKPMPPIG